MKRNTTIYFFLLALVLSCTPATKEITSSEQASITTSYLPPSELYGQLLFDVQMEKVFEDGKTFVDCIPKISPDSIVALYEVQKQESGFNLKKFVLTYFDTPKPLTVDFTTDSTTTLTEHVNRLWDILEKPADGTQVGTRISLKHPYVVPGGRFLEIYYWDTYFTILGLEVSGKYDLIESILDNFSESIDQFGFIPNGSRTYFLGRSQPPFFALMVDLLAAKKGPQVWEKYLPALEKEYTFWMIGSSQLSSQLSEQKRVVLLDSDVILNRHWDNFDGPRDEMLADDVLVANNAEGSKENTYKHLRAGAESGWDYTSRWFADGQSMHTIETTDIIPVDLNALLYNLEHTIAKGHEILSNPAIASDYRNKAQQRRDAIITYCWDEKAGYFTDYNFVTKTKSDRYSIAGVVPLCFNIASDDQASKVAATIQKDFLKDGGVVSTLSHTGQQWDAPNGWAPQQWMAVWGLKNYGQDELAFQIADRWTRLNERVFSRTGKMMEKYNVEDITLDAGGGEYPVQDGFGWTNGVYLKLKSQLD